MSYIKRKRSFHPLLAALYVLLYAGISIYALYVLPYNTKLNFSFLLSARFPEGVVVPVFFSLVVFAGSLLGAALLMHEILVKRFELSRKLNLHFFIIPLIVLTAPGIIEATTSALFILVSAVTLYFVLSMATFETDIKKVFLSGLFAGVLFLLTSSSAVLLLIFPLILFANRIFSVKAVMVYGFAFILPLGYVLAYFYLTDFTAWGSILKSEAFNITSYGQLFELVNGYILAFLLLLIIIVVSRVHLKLSEYKIAIRRAYSSMLFFVLVFSASIVLMPVLYRPVYVSSLIFIALYYYMRLVSDVKKRTLSVIIYVLPALIYAANILLSDFGVSLFY